MNKIIALLLISFAFTTAFGQETFSIKGTVSDSINTPIVSGNIILLSIEDSTVIKGTHFWDGEFILGGIQDRDVILKVQSPSFETYYEKKTFDPNDSSINLGNIVLNPLSQDLEDVNVVYRKPMFERKTDRLIVNVDGTILSEKGSVLDLLRSAPNVIVKSSGSIEVVGKGRAIIYVDGRRINNTEILNSLSANDIDRVEVVDNPGARYDAEGNAVIEIITKSGALNGFEGSVGLRGMFRTEQQMAYWANYSFRKDWFSIYASIGQYTGTLHEDETYFREVFNDPRTTMDNIVDREIKHNFDTWYNVNTDFRIDSLNTLFLTYAGSRLQSNPFVRNSNEIYEDDVYQGSLYSESNGIEKRFSHSLAGGYKRSLDTLNSAFRITGQFTNFNSRNEHEIVQTSNFSSSIEDLFNSYNRNLINVYTVQSDLMKNFKEYFSWNSGVKYSSVNNQSNVDLQQYVSNQWVTDSSTYNYFDYSENIGAAYTELRGDINKWHFLTGLRYEGTSMKGQSYISGTGVVDRTYHSLFPNVQLSYDITKDLILSGTYSYRINRPSFQDMDPFVIFVDSLTSFKGNPQLVPSYTHNSEISLVYMEYASIKLGYQKSIDPMFLTVEKDPVENTFSAITKNIQSSEMYTLGLVLPWENKWWTTFNAVGYYFNRYQYEDNQEIIASTEPTWYVSIYNEFRIPKVFNIELNYEYISPGSQGFFIAKPYHYFMATISRKFLDDKLAVNLSAFDPFKWNIERADASLQNFYVNYSSWMDSRSFMITLRYNFGKLKDPRMVGKSVDSDQQNRIKK